MDEQDFDAAIPILVKLAELQTTLYKTSSDWAAAELPRAKQKQEKLRERVRAACEKVRALLKTYNYAEATQLLDALPAPARSEEANRLLSQAGQNFEDCLGLQQEIDNAVKSKQYEQLLPLVKRFLKLKPDSVKMQNWARNLTRNRPERAIRHYKGTSRYFDVAGRLVDVKELVVGVGLIAALVLGVTYGVRNYGEHLRTLVDSAAPKAAPGGQVPPAGEERRPQSGTSAPEVVPAVTPPVDTAGQSPQAKPTTPIRATADDDTADSPQPITETWTTADGWTISPGNPTAVYALPDHPPEEYTVSMRARRLTGKNTFAIGLPVGDKQVLVALDAHGGTVSGLEFLDGKHVHNNEATRRGRLLPPDREAMIKCTVRKEGISGTCEGLRFLDWRGNLSQLSLPAECYDSSKDTKRNRIPPTPTVFP